MTARASTRVVYPWPTGPTPTLATLLGCPCDQEGRGRDGPSWRVVPEPGQDRHIAHHRDHVHRRLVAEVPVQGADVRHHSLAFAPAGVRSELDVPRALERRHPGLVSETRFGG